MLAMDENLWSSGDFQDGDEGFPGPSMDIDELWNILKENPGPPQNTLNEQFSFVELVPDASNQDNSRPHTGLQLSGPDQSSVDILSGSLALFPPSYSKAPMSGALCSDTLSDPLGEPIESDRTNYGLPSQNCLPLQSCSGSHREWVHNYPQNIFSFNHHDFRETQYEIPDMNTAFSSSIGETNQVLEYRDYFGLDCLNNDVKSLGSNFENPNLGESSTKFLGVPEKYSCLPVDISLVNADNSFNANYAQCTTSPVPSGICIPNGHLEEMQCPLGKRDNNPVVPSTNFSSDGVDVRLSPNSEGVMIGIKSEGQEFSLGNASFQLEGPLDSSTGLSALHCFDGIGSRFKYECSSEIPSSSKKPKMNVNEEPMDEKVAEVPWAYHKLHDHSMNESTSIKVEKSEIVAQDGVGYQSADLKDEDDDYSAHAGLSPISYDSMITDEGSDISLSGGAPSVSNMKHVAAPKVEEIDAFMSSGQTSDSQDVLSKATSMAVAYENSNRNTLIHVAPGNNASNVKQSGCKKDEKEVQVKQAKVMVPYMSKVKPKSIRSSSLDKTSPDGDSDSDICIIEEISQPARSILPRIGLVTPPRVTFSDPYDHMGVGAMRLRSNDERSVLRVALQDLSQQKSEEASPPDGLLAVPLLRHQRMALSWMLHKEMAGWNCFGGILADDQGLGKTISTIALILKERPPSSRVCQQDMRRGKCETLNLDGDDNVIVDIDGVKQEAYSSEDRSFGSPVNCVNTLMQSKGRPSAGTLVVCPTSVLRQWDDELRSKVTREADLSILIYHGVNRTKDPSELAKYDVVLTTYSIVSMEVPKQPLVDKDEDEKISRESELSSMGIHSSKKRKNPPTSGKKGSKGRKGVENALLESIGRPLAKVQWFRVVLDEAQSIKNYRTQMARACWGLRAKRRWCLSGTPIQNSVDDLYSYFRFLKYDPYCVYKVFCEMIKVPISRNPAKGYKKLQAVLKTIMLRRTKSTFIDGEPIIKLPPKTIELKKVEFSEEERDFYTRLEADSRAQFEEYAAAGTVKQNYVNILLMLLRLRQACDHPLLVKEYESLSAWKSSVASARELPREKQICLLSFLEASLAICGICNDAPEDAVVSLCGHVFCNQCICEHLTGVDNQCPAANCKVQLKTSSVFSKATLNDSLSEKPIIKNVSDSSGSGLFNSFERHSEECCYSSSKLKAALEVLTSISKPHDARVQGDTFHSYCERSTEPLLEESPELVNKKKNMVVSSNSTVPEGEKAIVFSQWTRMLDLLEDHLKDSSIQYRRLDGTMSVAARDKAVKDFNNCPEVSVMIMSLKAASLGLNMVAACHVILLDLWWNPTTEDQAIDRAHRIGQTRPVRVLRLTVKDTVEDRILALQQKKREMVASAFGEDETGSRESRLTVDDLKYLFMCE